MQTQPVAGFDHLLRRARRAANLTQEALAERAGISAGIIRDLECGVIRAPRRDTLELLADALELAPDERTDWERLRRRLSKGRESPANQRSNLPQPLTTLVGRTRELAELRQLLRQPHARLITLTGPGGVGKTRLALAVATELVETLRDGAVFISLAPVSDPQLVPVTISRTLGSRVSAEQTANESLIAFLESREFLLLLDNFEHLLDAASLTAELLATCPHLKVLVTSRARLRMRGEHEFPIGPLALPAPETTITTDETIRVPAVALFVDQMRKIQPDFCVRDGNVAIIVEICRRLDGLPLAIELAAARVKVLPLPALLERLEQRLPLLTGGPRDLPARQRTLRDAIAWSYDLLTETDQRLFRHLCIFPGGATLEAVEAVTGENLDSVLDGLERLVEHSFIRVQAPPDGIARYTMLETIREFGLAWLHASGDADEARQRHAVYWLTTTDQWDLFNVLTPETLARHRRVDAEHHNLRAALTWSLEHDPLLALKLASAIWSFWNLRGYLREGREWLERALDAATDAPADIRANALLGAGTCASNQGDVEEARLLLAESLALCQAHGELVKVAFIHRHLGYDAYLSADFSNARAHSAESLAIGRELNDDATISGALANLAAIALLQGDLTQAAAFAEEGIAIARREADASGLYMHGRRLASIALREGDFTRASEFLGELLALSHDSGSPSGTVDFLAGYAALAGHQGQPQRAARLAAARDALRKTYGLAADPIAEQDIARARVAADRSTWDAAWAEGLTMSREEAIAYALEPSECDVVEPTAVIPGSLTAREVEVLQLVADGLTDAKIAEKLFVSRRTVTSHLTNIFNKLGVNARAAAVATAARLGIL